MYYCKTFPPHKKPHTFHHTKSEIYRILLYNIIIIKYNFLFIFTPNY